MTTERPKIVLERVKAYKVILSTKTEIKLDSDEISRVVEGIKTGNVVRIRQGLFNPSYFVAIVEDEERRLRFLDDTKYEEQKRLKGITPLLDILGGVKLKELSDGVKMLGSGK